MKKILKKIKKYTVEIVVLAVAFIIAVISLIIFIKNNVDQNETGTQIIDQVENNKKFLTIYVDVSGSVNKPDLYEIKNGSRLKEVIKKAGGLSSDADKNFFGRNFNLARIVSDQEKIYVPSSWEVQNGYFVESPQSLNYISSSNLQPPTSNHQSLININSASLEELDTLPGIGKITAQKIIDNRPFKALDELINKKIINKSVFENLKNSITL